MSNSTPEELALAASRQGTFSFIERLRGRGMPKDSVDIYLDEELGYRLVEVEMLISVTTNKEQLAALEAEAEELKESLRSQKYTLFFEGISNKRYDELVDLSCENYPYEYEETTSPFTGVTTRTVITNEDRDRLFTNMLWAAIIRKVVDPSGSEQVGLSPEDAEALRQEGPRHGVVLVAETIDKMRMAVEWMQYIQDEDFSLKP